MSELVNSSRRTWLLRKTLPGLSAGFSLCLWLLLSFPPGAGAQCMDGGNPCSPKIPRLVKFTGTLRDAEGQPRTGTVGVTFAIYSASTGGERLWQETQNVQLDQQGHYEAMLGAASEGMPMDLFASGEPRWLGVQVQSPGEEEQAGFCW